MRFPKFSTIHLVYIPFVIVCSSFGYKIGTFVLGNAGGITGIILGVLAGLIFSPLFIMFFLCYSTYKIKNYPNKKLLNIVYIDRWTWIRLIALHELADREVDLNSELPRILDMLESKDTLTRVYGWDALRIVFTPVSQIIPSYNPRDDFAKCQSEISGLREYLKTNPMESNTENRKVEEENHEKI